MIKVMRSTLAIPWLLLLVLPGRSAAKPGSFASLGLGRPRSGKVARAAAKAPVAVTQSLDLALPAPPVDRARSLLVELDRTQLSTALRWAGVEHSELLGGRETTNLGLDQPVDRWRLPSAEAALVDPLWLPDRVGDLGQALSEDLSGDPSSPIPSWASLRTLAAQEFGPSQMVGCLSPPSRGLYRQAVEVPGLRRRQAAYLREQLSIRLDEPVGELLSQASLARCRLDLALSRLSAEERASVRAALASGLTDQVDSEDDARASRALSLSAAWEKVDRSLLAAGGVAWSQAVRSAAEKLRTLPMDAWPDGPLQVQTALGTVWIGSPENDIMQGDPLLILDPGGDDDWIIARDRGLDDTAWVPPVRGVIDLGGDDRYGGGAASVGGALLGFSAGVDLGGDDSWHTGSLSQGAAWFGVSTWVDVGGDDTFYGSVAVQGFAAYGLAVLRMAGEGDDTLRAGAWAQGCAWSSGVGVLHDGGGDDRYVLGGAIEDSPNRLPGYHDGYGQGFSAGQRPWLGGGIGWLQDDGGHDRYSGGLWVQGSSYWHSLGVLLDRSGNDVYTSDQYGQGSGSHLSVAGLFDLGGDDRYLTRKLGQGSGQDLAVSWLLDGRGDDVYTGQDLVQGAAINNAVSLFMDRSGDDLYLAATEKRQGYAGLARGYSSVAAFVDGAGHDRYLPGDVAGTDQGPAHDLPQQGHGVALDLVRDDPVAPDLVVAPPDLGPVPTDAETAQRLLLDHQRWTAPAAETRVATKLLYEVGPKVVAWILPLTSGELYLRSHTIGAVIQRFVASADAAARPQIADALLASLQSWPVDALDDSVRWHIGWIGDLYRVDPALRAQAMTAVDIARQHPAWAVRRQAWILARAVALGGAVPRIMGQSWGSEARQAMVDGVAPGERAAAARYVGVVGDGDGTRALVGLLRGGDLEERSAAEDALIALTRRGAGTLVLRALTGLALGPDGVVRDAALRIAGASGLSAGLVLVEQGLASRDAATRRAAAQGLAANPSPAAELLAEQHRSVETDPRVLSTVRLP